MPDNRPRNIPSMIGQLHDVDVSTTPPSDGDVLVWADGAKRWVPGVGSIEKVHTVSSSGATQTLPDVTTATMHDITLTANCTFTFPTAGVGKSFSMRLKQDGTGSRGATWPSSVKWDAGATPVLSTAASAVDTFWFVCFDGTRWEAGIAGLGHA